MKIIKLDAIDSTNDFLKNLIRTQTVENFTVVVAKTQTAGKGQMGAKWETESGKNLTCSILVKNFICDLNDIFNINILVSVSIIEVLNALKILNLSVKWPNDILSDNKKIGGILIENNLKSNKTIESVVGIGLNVNQSKFDGLPNASSLLNCSHQFFELDEILLLIASQIKNNHRIYEKSKTHFWEYYHQNLYHLNVISLFEDEQKNQFQCKIIGVSNDGKLIVKLNDDSNQQFSLKEIKMIL